MKARFAVAGLGGFAGSHHSQIDAESVKGRASLIAVAEIAPERYQDRINALRSAGVRIYRDALELIEKEKNNIDIITFPVGIAAHAPLSIAALRAGMNVFVEKPPAAVIQDVDDMIRVSEETGKFCAVGFNCQSLPHVRAAKEFLLSGVIGKARILNCAAEWPRTDVYYKRNSWAGKCYVNDAWVLDGPMNNALAHQLMNLLWFASPSLNETAAPISVRAELYRARQSISGDDTASLCAETDSGAVVFLNITHACAKKRGPFLRIECSGGKIEGELYSGLTAENYETGEKTEFVPRPASPISNMLDYYFGVTGGLDCPVRITRNFTLAVNAAHESSGGVHDIPARFIKETFYQSNDPRSSGMIAEIENISSNIDRSYKLNKTFSETGVEWAVKTKPFDCRNYKKFTGVRRMEVSCEKI